MSTLKSKSGPRRRVINLRAALILAVIVGGTVFGGRKLHDQQMARTLQFLRETAFKSVDAEDYRGAQLQFSQYLALKDNDLEAREKLSWLLTETIKTTQALDQAFRINEDLLRKGLTNDDLRLRHARIAVQLGRIADAEAHLTFLQTSRPDDAEVWYLSAVTANEGGDAQKVEQRLKRSLRCPAKVPEAYEFLSRVANDSTPPEFQPDALMARMITDCPVPKAWHIRADYLMSHQHFTDAINDLWKALESTPDDMVLNAKLVRCLQSGEFTNSATSAKSDASATLDASVIAPETVRRALVHFESRITAAPQNPAIRLYLANVRWKNKERAGAIAGLESGIQMMPRAFALHEALIEYLVVENQAVKARRILESIPAGGLSRDVYHYCLGRILMAEGQWKQAALSLEQTLAFGKKKSSLFARAQMSFAVCRSRSGESHAAVEAFRSAVSSSPDSIAARLGIAAAWVQSGQLDFAIAEYKQLQDVPGVSAGLADLLIRKNLQQSASLRNWDEVDSLIREENPIIPDPLQRQLLRADRLFAVGQILPAVRTLEHAVILYPNRPEAASAMKRIQSEFGAAVEDRLTQLVKEDPTNSEVHAAQIRCALSSGGIARAVEIVDTIKQQDSGSERSREPNLQLVIQTLNHVIGLERQFHRQQFIASLEELAVEHARQLAKTNPVHERELIRTLVRAGHFSEAMQIFSTEPQKGRPELRAAAILEAVRSSSDRASAIPESTRTLYALISRHPENVELRLYYAEIMLYGRHYNYAEQTLAPLQTAAAHDARINALRAWLRSAEEKDLGTAVQLAATAVKTETKETIFREVQARVLLSQNEPAQALQILKAIPSERLSLAGQVYLATALMKLDREREAQVIFDQMHAVNDQDSLLPADEDLLESLGNQILNPTTASR